VIGHLHIHIVTEILTFAFVFTLALPCQIGYPTNFFEKFIFAFSTKFQKEKFFAFCSKNNTRKICEPNANKSLIAMTAGMLAGDIEIAMAQAIKAHPISSPPSRPAETIQASQVEEAEIDEKIAPVLEQIKEALAMTIGPIAGPVMKDNIEIWSKQNTPSLSSLPALAKLLCSEIDDKILEQKFMAEVNKFTA